MQICPWCYIAHIELQRAIATLNARTPAPRVSFKIEHRPFKLQPSLPEETELDKRTWYRERFGEEKAKAIESAVRARASEVGVDL